MFVQLPFGQAMIEGLYCGKENCYESEFFFSQIMESAWITNT